MLDPRTGESAHATMVWQMGRHGWRGKEKRKGWDKSKVKSAGTLRPLQAGDQARDKRVETGRRANEGGSHVGSERGGKSCTDLGE